MRKSISDRQRARKVYGFIQRLPDIINFGLGEAESEVSVTNIDWKESVRVASTTNVVLGPPAIITDIDGETLVDGDRILLKDQLTSSENGIYILDDLADDFVRASDATPGTSLTSGATVYVEDGTINEGQKWVLATKTVTLGGAQSWVLFDKGNDWIVSGLGGEMKTNDPVSIGADYPSTIGPDIFFYVSGSRGLASGNSNANVAVFSGDVILSGSLNLLNASGLNGDILEISGSTKITTGSLYFQKAGTNDYSYFINSSTGVSFQSGSGYHTGSLALGYGSQTLASSSLAVGLFSKAQRFGEYSQASSGFSVNYVDNALGKTQYSRVVWCGVAATTAHELLFKGYNSSGDLTPFFNLENSKAYSVKATAIVVDTGDITDSATFIREALFYKTGNVVTRLNINSTLSLPNALTYDLDIVVSGSSGNTDIAFVLDSIGASFATSQDIKGTVSIELNEIQIS